MTESDRRLLIVDLSARLPYKPKVQFNLKYGDNGHKEGLYPAMISSIDPSGWIEVDYEDGNSVREWSCTVEDIKPYLRPISDITDDEKRELNSIANEFGDEWFKSEDPDGKWAATFWECYETIDFLNSIHVDYRGLIDKGLALKAVKGMYI